MSKRSTPFEELSTHLPTLAALLVCASVLYDWAYFFVVGLKFFMLMSISDHLASFLEMLPLFMIPGVLGFFLSFPLMGKLEKKVLSDSDFPREVLLRKVKLALNWTVAGYILFGVAWIIFAYLSNRNFYLPLVTVLPSSFLLFAYNSKIFRSVSRERAFAITAMGVMCLSVVSAGAALGYADKYSKITNETSFIEDGTGNKWLFLRGIERGAILRSYSSPKLALVSWNDLHGLSTPINNERTPLKFCEVFTSFLHCK